MQNLGKFSLLAVLLLGQAIACSNQTGSARLALCITGAVSTLTADGGAPPAPPIPLSKGETNLVADGGAPPAPPIPLSKGETNLVADGGAPPAPPIPLARA